jgi:hypothetical protein
MTPQQAIRAANKYLSAGNKPLAIELLRHALQGAPDPVETRIAANRLKDLGVEPLPKSRIKRSLGEGAPMARGLRIALIELIKPYLDNLARPLPVGTHRQVAEKTELPPAVVHRVIHYILTNTGTEEDKPEPPPPPPPPPRPAPRQPPPRHHGGGGGFRGGRRSPPPPPPRRGGGRSPRDR